MLGEDMCKEDAHRKHIGMDDCAHPSGCRGDMRNDGTVESIWVEMTAHIRRDEGGCTRGGCTQKAYRHG